MFDRCAREEPAALGERRLDDRVGLEHLEAGHKTDIGKKPAVAADGRVELEAVPHAGGEVVGAMARRRVDGARALFERDVGRQHAQRLALVERVDEREPLHDRAGERRDLASPNARPVAPLTASARPSATTMARPSTSNAE